MNNKKDNYSIKSYQKKRIQTPRETSNFNENDIISDNKAKSSKKFEINNKNQAISNNQNNINSINIINNNFNNYYVDSNRIKQNKNIVLEDKNFGLITLGNIKDKSIKKSKALKLLFNKNTNDKFNENKYQYIINRLKYEIEYYKNKNKVKSNQIISNSPKSFRKKVFNKNLFLNSNKYNTIKTYDNKSNIDIDTNRKIKSDQIEKYNNYVKDNKLTSDFSLKNNLKLNINTNSDINYVPKSYSNNFMSIDTNRTLNNMNKRPKINYIQNNSLRGIDNNNNYLSNEIIYEREYNNIGKSSFSNIHNPKIYLKGTFTSPLSLKNNIKNIYKHYDKEENNEININQSNYKDKFENLKNRMNKLIGNLFVIIDFQKDKINKMKNN